MSENITKKVSVLVVDQTSEHKGIIANVGLVLGLTAGRELPQETFGGEVIDGDGHFHRYLTKIGHYVRKAGQSKIRSIRDALRQHPEVLIVDYTEDAAPADYSQYAENLKKHSGEQIQYRAIYFYGPDNLVTPLTKNLSRLE